MFGDRAHFSANQPLYQSDPATEDDPFYPPGTNRSTSRLSSPAVVCPATTS